MDWIGTKAVTPHTHTPSKFSPPSQEPQFSIFSQEATISIAFRRKATLGVKMRGTRSRSKSMQPNRDPEKLPVLPTTREEMLAIRQSIDRKQEQERVEELMKNIRSQTIYSEPESEDEIERSDNESIERSRTQGSQPYQAAVGTASIANPQYNTSRSLASAIMPKSTRSLASTITRKRKASLSLSIPAKRPKAPAPPSMNRRPSAEEFEQYDAMLYEENTPRRTNIEALDYFYKESLPQSISRQQSVSSDAFIAL
jgi:hypothetical protein